ncbi:acyltransferase family protein [Streptomyces sp. NPDC055808]|uniref:acyltransferase family protein n=1 Tax=Streptomyces sp. NPDC001828 TaxID=3364615 RepID=UPI0036CB597D
MFQPRPATRPPRLAALDGLRLVAALMVVGYHYMALKSAWGHDPATIFPTMHRFAQFGWLGVEVFFLVSGFVICMSVWGRTIGDFAVSRVSRLFPAYWVAVPLTALVIRMWPEVSSIRSWDDVIVNLTMVQAGNGTKDIDGAYWTLFVEIKFYVLMAIVVLCGVTYRNVLVFCGVWTVAAALAPVLGTPALSAFAMPQYAPFFIAGIAFYLMRRFGSNPLLWGLVLFQFLLAQRYIRYRMASNLGRAAADHLPTWPVRLIIIAGFVMVGAIALGALDKVQWKWLSTAGAITYPLYLIHMFIGLTLIHHFRGQVPAPVLVVSVTVLMMVTGWLIHRFVERPASKWVRNSMKRGIADVRENTPARRHRRVARANAQPPVAPAASTETGQGVPAFSER